MSGDSDLSPLVVPDSPAALDPKYHLTSPFVRFKAAVDEAKSAQTKNLDCASGKQKPPLRYTILSSLGGDLDLALDRRPPKNASEAHKHPDGVPEVGAPGTRPRRLMRAVSPLRPKMLPPALGKVRGSRVGRPVRFLPLMVDASTQTDESSLSSLSALSLSSRSPSPVRSAGFTTSVDDHETMQFDDEDGNFHDIVPSPPRPPTPHPVKTSELAPLQTFSEVSPDAPLPRRLTKKQETELRREAKERGDKLFKADVAAPVSASVGDLPASYLARPPTPIEPWVLKNEATVRREKDGTAIEEDSDESTESDGDEEEVDENGNLIGFVEQVPHQEPAELHAAADTPAASDYELSGFKIKDGKLLVSASPEGGWRKAYPQETAWFARFGMADHHAAAVADADMEEEGEYGDSGDEPEDDDAAEERAYQEREGRYIAAAEESDAEESD